MLPLSTRQGTAFNQPLSLDTSSVTNMREMFGVRSARALPSASTVRASLLLAPPTTPPHAPACLPACRPSSYGAPFFSAERVGVQPAAELRHIPRHRHGSHVYGALCACPALSLLGASLLLVPPTTPPHPPACLPACRPPLYASPFYSAGHVGIQPAAEPRHVQRHRHGVHVSRAFRACPALSLHSRGLPAACATDHRTPPFRLLARMSPLLLCFPPCFSSAERVGVQPATELRHVQRHEHEVDVWGALRACPALSLHSWAFAARCLHRRRFHMPSCLPARMSPLLPCLPFYSAAHIRAVRREQAPHPLCMVGQCCVCQPVFWQYGLRL